MQHVASLAARLHRPGGSWNPALTHYVLFDRTCVWTLITLAWNSSANETEEHSISTRQPALDSKLGGMNIYAVAAACGAQATPGSDKPQLRS